ncbi:MAG: DUF411 domain-containing protein, partial [Alphaproteobacteria bacterium]|nr:DUF411 domain-containing protein [Alphaproteobacteria bacterium]
MNRRNVLALLAVVLTGPVARADSAVVHVSKTATCGCCSAWVDHLRRSGFQVTTEDLAAGQLMRFKLDHGITPQLASCHTARVAGYTIEGHVPAREVTRLLKERPAAIGLTVPGMPVGSPGMEAGDARDPFDVLLIGTDGHATVYAS